MIISVIIPTYRRPLILKRCLKALNNQTLNKKFFQLLVIPDYKHAGPAWARNVGIKKAKGKIILFLDDDIIATPDLLKKHFSFHQAHPQVNLGLLGKVVWHPQLKINSFMEWLEFSGMQADYQHLKNNQRVSSLHFYTSNISLKKELMIKNGFFDENFKYPLFEDTELGYRLSKKGFKLIYSATALAYHWHPVDLNSYLKKMKLRAIAGCQLYRKHPELKGKIFPTQLPAKEILRLKFWQVLYPLGKLFNSKKILFNNYQRLVNEALLKEVKLQSKAKNG